MINNGLRPFCFICGESYPCSCGQVVLSGGYGGSTSPSGVTTSSRHGGIVNVGQRDSGTDVHISEMMKAQMQAYMHEQLMQNDARLAQLEPKRTNKKLLLLRRKA